MPSRRRNLVLAALWAGLALAGATPGEAAHRRPNFVVLLADDLGYGDLSSFGHPTLLTPNLDRMAREGLKLTSFYSGAPLCTPSRAALMTGRYPMRSGLFRVLFPEDTGGMPASEVTLAEALAGGGYRTMAIGKWHLGHRSPFLPTENGFGSYYGLLYSNDMKPPRTEVPLRLYRDAEPVDGEVDQGRLTEDYTREAIAFLRAAGDDPFFLYLAYAMPHKPLHVSERFAGKSRRGLYGDAVEAVDWSVGEILRAIDQAGLGEDTLVLFTSDNGPALSQELAGGSAGLLRAGKGATYEGGMRVPCVVRWSKQVPPGQVRAEWASVLDLLPTFLELAGVSRPAGVRLDGRNVVPLLRGEPFESSDRFYYFRGPFLEAVREGSWKLRATAPPGGGGNRSPEFAAFLARSREEHRTFLAADVFGDSVAAELYDLARDPSEQFDLAAEHPEVVARLRAAMQEMVGELEPGPAFDLVSREIRNDRARPDPTGAPQ
jgi:arylsulfatase A-like enzyme